MPIETSLHRLESKVNQDSSPQPSEHALQSKTVDRYPEPLSSLTPASDLRSGRLVCEDGDTRYVTSGFWPGLDNVDEDESAKPSNKSLISPPATDPPTQHRAPVFDSTTRPKDLHLSHPTGNNVFALWQVFVENVDPVFKILHVPTTQRQILRASQDPTQIPPAFESLMFAVYYAAITSIQSSSYLQNLFQEERQSLLDRYRHGVERSLETANFMSTPDVNTLQALTIFLTCARQTLDKTYIWSMTGLLIRLAMKLGLHRDPVFLEVPSFWAEMRRRLWWCIATLDVRTAEENDMDPFICEHMFDTKFPANVNDADLHLNMTEPAPNLPRHTEMLYSLIRFEGSYAARKLVFSPKFAADNQYPAFSLPEKNDFIESLLKDFDHRYLRHCDTRIPICLLSVTSIRIVLAKVKLTINHPACNNAVPLSNAQLRDLTQSSVEIIEYAHMLRTNDNYSRWIWLFQKYIEWDAIEPGGPSTPSSIHGKTGFPKATVAGQD
ncbi:hypothetical protein AYO22_00621 [Fonsecaea multimorphosa]|nr:hypothetical protein AYO22_00621 [Fonsecaea multimorphosa]